MHWLYKEAVFQGFPLEVSLSPWRSHVLWAGIFFFSVTEKEVPYWLKTTNVKKNVFYYNNNFSWRLTSSPTVFVLASVAGICLILMISTEMRERNAFSSKDLSVFWQKKKKKKTNTFFPPKDKLLCLSPCLFLFPTSFSIREGYDTLNLLYGKLLK